VNNSALVSANSLSLHARIIAMGFAIAASASAAPRSKPAVADPSGAGPQPLPVYELKISAENWAALRRNPGSDDRLPAKFMFGGREYVVGVRYRGDWARSWPKKPLKIFFKEESFDGRSVLNLNSNWRDPAFIRERLAYHIYSVCGVPASETRMIKLNVNGEFHGVFLEVEQPSKPFLRRVGLKGAVVYKTNSPHNMADESDLGREEVFRVHYEKETRKDEGYGDLQSFCHDLATTRDIAGFFHTRVDVDRYVNFLAGNVLVQNWDWFSKNHLLVCDAANSKKWFVVPWDLDRTLGDHWTGSFGAADVTLQLGTQARPGNIGWNKLFDAFYKVPALRQRLFDRLDQLLQTEFTKEKLFPILDLWEAELSADVALDRQRWPNPGSGDLHTGIAEVKQYIVDRRAYLLREVKTLRKSSTGR
jgi:spore coat protein H